ncbi:hypothetical protein SDC9_86473 [bioreactor metagenome]|uniref:Uncharacterized protein n=1 Tax=bioreactor metagenome TaxID=1076179 RepID=A0A644ZGI9_9ZZZZ
MAKEAHIALPGVKSWVYGYFRLERIVTSVHIAYTIAELAICGRATGGFDPGVLIWRNCLRSHLPTQPIGLFRQDNLAAQAQG